MESKQTSITSSLSLILSFLTVILMFLQNRELIQKLTAQSQPELKPEPKLVQLPNDSPPSNPTDKAPFDPDAGDDLDDSEAFQEYLKGGEYDPATDQYFKLIGFQRAGT